MNRYIARRFYEDVVAGVHSYTDRSKKCDVIRECSLDDRWVGLEAYRIPEDKKDWYDLFMADPLFRAFGFEGIEGDEAFEEYCGSLPPTDGISVFELYPYGTYTTTNNNGVERVHEYMCGFIQWFRKSFECSSQPDKPYPARKMTEEQKKIQEEWRVAKDAERARIMLDTTGHCLWIQEKYGHLTRLADLAVSSRFDERGLDPLIARLVHLGASAEEVINAIESLYLQKPFSMLGIGEGVYESVHLPADATSKERERLKDSFRYRLAGLLSMVKDCDALDVALDLILKEAENNNLLRVAYDVHGAVDDYRASGNEYHIDEITGRHVTGPMAADRVLSTYHSHPMISDWDKYGDFIAEAMRAGIYYETILDGGDEIVDIYLDTYLAGVPASDIFA